jgi:hypothetical protein
MAVWLNSNIYGLLLKDGRFSMATLEEFLRTGHLGPLVLGISSNDAISAVGEPDDISRKSNPLLLRYGCVHLVFWKPKDAKHELREITVDFHLAAGPLPSSLEFADWDSTVPPTERRFRDFVRMIDYVPVQSIERATSRELVFASGITARFEDEMLVSIRLIERENKASTPVLLADEREPTIEQISEMFNEAEIAAMAGAKRAALLLAWAGLEASLRRAAFQAGRKGRVGTQPVVLLRELFAEGRLSPPDNVVIEHLRQMRMSTAHGLNPIEVPTNVVDHIREVSDKLLAATPELKQS